MIRLALISSFPVQTGLACQGPVGRYPLERWEADRFRLQPVYRKPLDPSFEKVLEGGGGDLSPRLPPLNSEPAVLPGEKHLLLHYQPPAVPLHTLTPREGKLVTT